MAKSEKVTVRIPPKRLGEIRMYLMRHNGARGQKRLTMSDFLNKATDVYLSDLRRKNEASRRRQEKARRERQAERWVDAQKKGRGSDEEE